MTYKKPCLGCGKLTSAGIPFTACSSCRQIIEKYMKVKESHANCFRKIRGIEQIKLKGEGDKIFTLNIAFSHIAEIEERIEWLKNCLMNLEREMRKVYEM